MHDPLPLPADTAFPPVRRSRLTTPQVDLGHLRNRNRMLALPMRLNGSPRTRLADLLGADIEGRPIAIRGHCFGCTAGQGSSCGGALN